MNIGGSDLALAKKLQEHLDKKRDGKGAAISAAIIIEGELVAVCSSGTRGLDDSPADIGDLYNVGSVSKVYCAAAIMKLVDMGLIELDAPVCKYLPRFTMRDPRYKDITVRMTLNHASGMPGSNSKKMMTCKWASEYMEENFEYWKNSKLKAEPGAFAVYCNDGFDVAVAVIEEVTGKRYIDFLRDNTTTPAGAPTTAMCDIDTNGRVMMSCKGKTPEWVNALGAGGVRCEIADCARFGWIFIEPNGILSRKSIDEINRPQGKTFLKNDKFTNFYGLGWDSVEYSNKNVDLGPGTLAKSGGTMQFSSELIVNPKYRVSAAISGTMDCQTKNADILCELIAIALKERGIDVVPKDEKPAYVGQPITDEIKKSIEGLYYSYQALFKLSVENDKISLFYYDGGDWKAFPSFGPPLEWNGEVFFNSAVTASFESYKDSFYLLLSLPGVGAKIPFAQKFNTRVPVSDGWKERIGKRYIVTNIAALDEISVQFMGVTIGQIDDSGLLAFSNCAVSSPLFAANYLVSSGDNDTNMYLDAPGIGSRDMSTYFTYVSDGVEYLRNGSHIYVDSDSLSELKSGRITSLKAEQDAVYKITAGKKLKFDRPEYVKVYMLSNNLELIYNGFDGAEIPETCDGYIIFANDAPMDFAIEVI